MFRNLTLSIHVVFSFALLSFEPPSKLAGLYQETDPAE